MKWKIIFAAVLVAVAVVFSLSTSTMAQTSTLTLVNDFWIPDGEGVAFDATSGNVVVTNGKYYIESKRTAILEFYDPVTGILESILVRHHKLRIMAARIALRVCQTVTSCIMPVTIPFLPR